MMQRAARAAALAVLFAALPSPEAVNLAMGQAIQPAYPSPSAYALPIDRGVDGLWRSLRQLNTRASLMMVVAHPDDEDGGMLAYESRGLGTDTTLLTLNRGEGGQNVMTGDYWDELGILRTQELLAAGRSYGVHQYWTRAADFGFSKTLDEALKTWGHDRILADVIRQVRITRPLVVSSVFAGNVSDGHGHHQTAGLMAQEAYKLAGDPKVFPEQIAAGLRPWSPLKVYARVPFARVTDKGIFDYATGHWEPVRFRNYVTGTWIEGVPTATVEIPEGTYNPLLGRSYLAVAREGLAHQKSQNDGVGIPMARPFDSPYHLYASRVSDPLPAAETGFFEGIDVSLGGIADYAPATQRAAWHAKLETLQATVDEATKRFDATDPSTCAPALARGLEQARALVADVAASSLPADAKYDMQHELLLKQAEFNTALSQALGMLMVATVDPINEVVRVGPFGDMRGNTPTYQVAIPGQPVAVNIHLADQGAKPVQVDAATLVPLSGDWNLKTPKPFTGSLAAGAAADVQVHATVPADAPMTKPYFSRPDLEQSYYNIDQPQYMGLPTAPYPLSARVRYTYAGVQADLSGVVQTTHLVNAEGPVLEPLLVAPAISLRVQPTAGVIPLGDGHLSLTVTLHSSVKGPAQGEVHLKLPEGWTSQPASAPFQSMRDGDEKNLVFEIATSNVHEKPYVITAVAAYDGRQYSDGFTTIGWPGIRPYPEYRKAEYRAMGVNVKVAPGLKVAYIMGTGDAVPAALEEIGVHVTQLSPSDVGSANLDGYDAILLGIRTYATRPDLRSFNNRLLDYVKRGGVVVSQYQTAEYDHNYGPFPISVPADAEKVVEEDTKATILDPADPLLNWPNKITSADFDHWVEERGHGFARTWAPEFKPLTEMHDTGQDPQKGGLLYAKFGHGYYIYLAFAFYREMPEAVPGSFRIMANLISAAKNPGLADHSAAQAQVK
jgi:LmbE family N-acetylglucosaminyl deacetylase